MNLEFWETYSNPLQGQVLVPSSICFYIKLYKSLWVSEDSTWLKRVATHQVCVFRRQSLLVVTRGCFPSKVDLGRLL